MMSDNPAQVMDRPDEFLDDAQRRWLRPAGPFDVAVHRLLYATAWIVVRLLFRFRVEGVERLPSGRPFLLAPNHQSSLDAPFLAAALPYSHVRNLSWAVRKERALNDRFSGWITRAARAVPVDRDISALAAGAAVLRKGRILVWFPEGTRSRDGQLRDFKFGVGALAHHLGVPVVPVGIDGSHAALPPDRRLPRFFARVVVRFGDALLPSETPDDDSGGVFQALADELRDRVDRLAGSD